MFGATAHAPSASAESTIITGIRTRRWRRSPSGTMNRMPSA
jgi:hypothetical protein